MTACKYHLQMRCRFRDSGVGCNSGGYGYSKGRSCSIHPKICTWSLVDGSCKCKSCYYCHTTRSSRPTHNIAQPLSYAVMTASGRAMSSWPNVFSGKIFFLEQLGRLTEVIQSFQYQQTMLQTTLTQLMSSQRGLNQWHSQQLLSYY